MPFDIDEAALSYHIQAGNKVIAAVSPHPRSWPTTKRLSAPPEFIPASSPSSSLAMLELLPVKGSVLVAHRGPGALTVLALAHGVVTLARSLELTQDGDILSEVSADLYPTLVYIEDQTGARPEKLIIAGFGDESNPSATRLAVELDIPTEAIDEPVSRP